MSMHRTPRSYPTRGPLWLAAVALSVALPTGLPTSWDDVGPTAARAEDDDPEVVAQAKLHYKMGLDAFQAGKYDVAIKELKKAYLLKRIPAILLNIGLTYRKMKDYDMSTYFYKKYLAEAPAEDKGRGQAEAALREIDEEKRAATAPAPTQAAKPAVVAAKPVEAAKPVAPAVKPAAPAADGAQAVAPAAPAAPAGDAAAPASEWAHSPIDAVPPGQTVDVRVQMPVMKGVKVFVFFRRDGQPKWDSVELKRRGNEKVARLPATVTGGRTFQYYIEARDGAGTLVKSSGSEASPNIVLIDPGAKQQVAEGQDESGSSDEDKPASPQGYSRDIENEKVTFDPKTAMDRLRQQLNSQEAGPKPKVFGRLGWIGVGVAGGGVLLLGGGGAMLGLASSWASQVSADSQCGKEVRIKEKDPSTGSPTGTIGCPNFSSNPTAALSSAVDSRYPGSPTSADYDAQGRMFNTVGIALTAAGGVALATGTALMITDVVQRRMAERGAAPPPDPAKPKLKPGQKTRKVRKVIEVEEPETALRVTPVFSPTTIGVAAALRF